MLITEIPTQPGLYVAYVDTDYPYAERKLLFWMNGWTYPFSDQKFKGHVYGHIGPLPVLKLEQ